jgi:orotidine-5'-phosphate decarboxylase
MSRKSNTELVVALDYSRSDHAFQLVESMIGLPVILKVGFELFLHAGPELIRELVHRKQRVFLDLKFHDIPNTVASAARQAAALQVEMFTLHLSGGSQMVKAVRDQLAEIPSLKPKVLGVSVLTSFDDVRWAEVTRALTQHAVTPSASVVGLVEEAAGWGVDGVVCSALELPEVRRRSPGLMTVVPGIRPRDGASIQADDQSRTLTPQEASIAGASAIVVGRPITRSANPRLTAETILKDLMV